MKKARNNFYDSVGIGLLNVGSRYMWFPVKTEWQGRGVDVVDGLAVKTGPMVPAAILMNAKTINNCCVSPNCLM
jgi:hypothetical protein